MSSTTRVGFVIPAVSDFADETLYYDNNVTTYEAELPIEMAASLPVSGNYSGRIRALSLAQNSNPPQPAYPFHGYVYNGTTWIPSGSAGIRRVPVQYSPGSGNLLNASGSEIFDTASLPSFNSIQVYNNSIIKFHCQFHLGWKDPFTVGGDSMLFNGKINIFINPTSGTQPTPTTPGAIRLSSPIVESDNVYLLSGSSANPQEYYYSELIWEPNTTGVIGVAAYLSATLTSMHSGDGVGVQVPTFLGPSISGVNGSVISAETLGLWSN